MTYLPCPVCGWPVPSTNEAGYRTCSHCGAYLQELYRKLVDA